MVEAPVPDSSDEEEEYKKLPKKYWPKDKLEEADRDLTMKVAMGDTEMEGEDVDFNAEQARLLAEHEVLEALI